MGRRKKCEQIKRTNNVMVRFTDAEYASISISAEQAGYPVAVYVRKSALDEHIEVHYNITAELPELQKLITEYPVFLEQRKEKFREHQQHHARRRVACAKCSPCEKVERNTDGCRKAHTDELPLCQVEKDLVFDFRQVFRDRHISHSSP